MRKEEIPGDILTLTFDFFYWFSRFEFSLKENQYLKNKEEGKNAEPGWDDFVQKQHQHYQLSIEAQNLLNAQPERQIVGADCQLTWRPLDLGHCNSELDKVVRLLKTVRNNLFHGGKHGGSGWEDTDRTRLLLVNGKAILDQLAVLADFQADYTQYY